LDELVRAHELSVRDEGGIATASVAGRSARADARAGRIRTGSAAALGLVLGLLALGPGLARGFLLSYDMVFVPGPPWSAALIGAAGGPPRAVPSDAVITAAARLLPADILQKAVLLLIFIAACSGAAALLAAGWRDQADRPAPTVACLVSGGFYAWNPFVAERLLIGQWALLLGYAGLPWVLRELCTGSGRIRPARLVSLMLPAAVGGFVTMTVTGLACVPAALARGAGWPARLRRCAIVLAVLAVLSLPWLIPSLLVPVRTDPRGVDLFAARADTPLGVGGSLVLLSGIWNSQTVPRGYGGAAAWVWLLVVGAALAGYLCIGWRRRMWPGLGVAGLAGLAVAAIGITAPTRTALQDLVAAWSGFGVLRDGQQFVAALALTEAIGLGALIAWVVRRAVRGSDQKRTEPTALALAVLALLAPVVLLPGMAWGMAGRMKPVTYPADWLTARQIIDSEARPGSVLVLPWGAYRRYPWNHGEAVYDPWNKLLSREVVSNDGLEVNQTTLTQESAAAILMNRLLATPGPLTWRLRTAGVRYVVVDTGPVLQASQGTAQADLRLPGARVLLASRDLLLFELPG
jgi:hypothetical protein